MTNKERTVVAINRAMQYALKGHLGSMDNCVVNLETQKTVPVSELYETIMLLRSTVLNKEEVRLLEILVRQEAGVLSSSKSMPEYEKWMARLRTILSKLEVLSGQS